MEVTEAHKAKTRQLIKEGRTIEAIKYLRQELLLDLKTASRLVRAITDQMDPSEITRPPSAPFRSFDKLSIIIPGIFLLIGIVMLGVAGYLYTNQQDLIEKGVKVKARVVSNPASPLFEYEFEGNIYQYQSSVSSNPPSYEMGEEIEFFVDINNPSDGLANTFTDRWLAIAIVGGMGAIFSAVSLLVIMVFRYRP